LRLKGDVSAEDSVEKLEDTPWVKDDEESPHVEVVEDGSEIWSELGTYLKKTFGSPRKRRKIKKKSTKPRARKSKRRYK